MIVQPVLRVWNLTHLRLSGLSVDLCGGAHLCSWLEAKNSKSRRPGWHELENQAANCLRLVFSGSTRQSIRFALASVQQLLR